MKGRAMAIEGFTRWLYRGGRPNSLARAIVASPRIILADEPTGNLHSDQGREIMRLFKRLNDEGITIVQVTHSEENAEYGDRIVRLADGWIEGATAATETR